MTTTGFPWLGKSQGILYQVRDLLTSKAPFKPAWQALERGGGGGGRGGEKGIIHVRSLASRARLIPSILSFSSTRHED